MQCSTLSCHMQYWNDVYTTVYSHWTCLSVSSTRNLLNILKSLKRKLRCRRVSERADAALLKLHWEQRELMTWTSAAGTHACKMGHGVMDVQRLSRHQNKEWPGYSRLECRSERERAPCAAKTSRLRQTTETEQAQSTRYTRVGHGVLYVQLQFSATKSGSFCWEIKCMD